MKSNDQTLQVEITIAPAKDRKGGRRRNPAEPTVPNPPSLPRIARLMALAVKFQEMVDRGEVRDYADLARLGYVSRARVTQIMNLILLAPDLQETLLFGGRSNDLPAERRLRAITRLINWTAQRAEFPASQVPQSGREVAP